MALPEQDQATSTPKPLAGSSRVPNRHSSRRALATLWCVQPNREKYYLMGSLPLANLRTNWSHYLGLWSLQGHSRARNHFCYNRRSKEVGPKPHKGRGSKGWRRRLWSHPGTQMGRVGDILLLTATVLHPSFTLPQGQLWHAAEGSCLSSHHQPLSQYSNLPTPQTTSENAEPGQVIPLVIELVYCWFSLNLWLSSGISHKHLIS